MEPGRLDQTCHDAHAEVPFPSDPAVCPERCRRWASPCPTGARGVACGQRPGRELRVLQARGSFQAEARESLVGGAKTDAQGLGHLRGSQPFFRHAFHKEGSSVDGESGIFMTVHSGSARPWLGWHLPFSE